MKVGAPHPAAWKLGQAWATQHAVPTLARYRPFGGPRERDVPWSGPCRGNGLTAVKCFSRG